MEKKILQEGFYEGKLLDYGIRLTKSGNKPSVTAVFQVHHDDVVHNVYWQGTFKGKDGNNNETTLKALVTMGLDDVNRISDLAAQRASGALNTQKSYNLKIAVEYDPEKQKSYNKVAFVNEMGGALKDLLHPGDFLPMVGGLGIAGDLKRLILEKNGGAIGRGNSKVTHEPDEIMF